MLARWHQLGLHVGVHLLELNACSLITCITIQGVSAEPLVNFFTKESSAISCLLFLIQTFALTEIREQTYVHACIPYRSGTFGSGDLTTNDD